MQYIGVQFHFYILCGKQDLKMIDLISLFSESRIRKGFPGCNDDNDIVEDYLFMERRRDNLVFVEIDIIYQNTVTLMKATRS